MLTPAPLPRLPPNTMNKTTIIVFLGAVAVGYFFANNLSSLPLAGKAYEMGMNGV